MTDFKTDRFTLAFRDAFLFIEDAAQTSIIMSKGKRKRASLFLAGIQHTLPTSSFDYHGCELSLNPLSDSLKLHVEIDEDCFNFFMDVECRTRIIVNIALSRLEELELFFKKGSEDDA